MKSKPSTSSHADESNICETTDPKDKGQNLCVIEWMRRVPSDRVFLNAEDRSWTYGEAFERVEALVQDRPVLVRPNLSPESVFAVAAGLSGGGVTVVGPHAEVDEPAEADLVVFTSGSTGSPKGVRLTLQNLESAAAASAVHIGHGAEDTWLLAMPIHHVGGLSIVVRQMYTGGAIELLPGFDEISFAAALHGAVTMVSVVPTMLTRIIEHGPFSDLRAVLVGGGSIRDGLLERAAAAGLPVLPTYGMTETFGQVATLKPGAPIDYKAHPLPGVEIRLQPDGLIAVRGDQVSPGYLGEPDRPDPWFITNDFGTIDDDGAVRVLGRADTVIVTGGENVSPERVEAVLREHPAIDELVVVGVPDGEWGEAIVCVYKGTASDLDEWARARLPGFMVPKRWVLVDSVPTTSVGKLDRSRARVLAE